MEGGRRREKRFLLSFPLPRHSFFFLLSSQLSGPTRAEALATQATNAYLLDFRPEQNIFDHVSHSTELVRVCLACQHFDFNSAYWISDNLHVICS